MIIIRHVREDVLDKINRHKLRDQYMYVFDQIRKIAIT
jgi:hypothetical protein